MGRITVPGAFALVGIALLVALGWLALKLVGLL